MGQNDRVNRIAVSDDVESLLEELEALVGPHGKIDWHHATRVSVRGAKGRYLKYEPGTNRWVFCAAVGDRMDVIDPRRICVRGSEGTRARNATGRYTGDAARMRPLLERLARIMLEDATGAKGMVAGEAIAAEEQAVHAPARTPVTEPAAPELAVVMSQGKEAALTSFLAEIFDGDAPGLRRWVRLSLGKEIHDELPEGSANLSQLVFETTLAIQRHGRASAALFASLHELRPHWADSVWSVARLYGVTRPAPEHAAPSPHSHAPGGTSTAASASTRAAPPPLDALAMRLEDALQRKQRLEAAGLSTDTVLAEIRSLKREHRRGGQLRPGDALGDRYLLAEQIGRGGFATVWRARDSASGDDVAIKVLHPELAGDVIRRQRFFRGARIMAELAHPTVVRVREREAEDDGFFYFVMDFIAGGNLQDAVLAGRVTGEQAVPLILSIGDALAQAHARGHVHRDVKPVNILLTESGAPRLTDFDLVTAQDTTGGTRTGALGTFIYAAPEMMDRPQDADARVDAYGLGMTLAFALHGDKLPRKALTARERFIDALACLPELRAVLRRATAEDPDERHPDAAAFCEALRAAITLDRRRAQSQSPARGAASRTTTVELGPRRLTSGAPPGATGVGIVDVADIGSVLASSKGLRDAALATARALEGIWTNPELGSVYCISLIQDRLIVPYCRGGNDSLTAVWYDCVIRNRELYCHFRWLNNTFLGHVSLAIESQDRLSGYWWHQNCKAGCPFPDGPSDFFKEAEFLTLERLPGHEMPDWAAAYLRRSVSLTP